MNARKFITTLKCPGCAQTGSVGWEEYPAGGGRSGLSRSMIFMSNGFHKAEGLYMSGDHEIACDVCETIQPD